MKKFISSTLFFLLFIGLSFAQKVEPKFEKQNELTKATYFYDNGDIKEIGFFKNDKLEGQWVSYDQGGKISMIANYENGKKEGKWYVVANDTVKELNYRSNQLIEVKNVKRGELPII